MIKNDNGFIEKYSCSHCFFAAWQEFSSFRAAEYRMSEMDILFSGKDFFWQYKNIFFKMLTFLFNGNGGIDGLGHLWYVSMAVQCYIFMPFLYLILKKSCQTQQQAVCAYILTVAAGFALRFFAYQQEWDWYTSVYTNCFMNLDIIISGMITTRIRTAENFIRNEKIMKKIRETWKWAGAAAFTVLILYNCYIYCMGTHGCFRIYRYVLPGVYISCCTLLVLCSGSHRDGGKVAVSGIRAAGSAAVHRFSRYSFAFYVFHICILQYLGAALAQTEWFLSYSPNIQYLIFFVTAFTILLPLSVWFTHWNRKAGEYFRQKMLSKPKTGRLLLLVAGILLLMVSAEQTGVTDRINKNANRKQEIPFQGEGTKEQPYLIPDADSLRRFADMVNTGYTFERTCFLQTDDIDLAPSEWVSIAPYDSEYALQVCFQILDSRTLGEVK